jgi:hypothetical protein
MNFDKLPSDIKRKIFDINRRSAELEKFKMKYNQFVSNFQDKVEGDHNFIHNDVVYNWKNQYGKVWQMPRGHHFHSDILDILEHKRRGKKILCIRKIRKVIDEGYVEHY